jgi:O-antigen biosynthesis protein
MDIEYTDGQAIEAQILRLIRKATDRSSRKAIADENYGDWPVRYHLCPERANLLRPFQFSGLDVLELGAGMGAVSRFIAENANSLYVVEGTQSRFNVLAERLSGLNNWSGEVGNFQEFETDQKFDVVALVGVLEYSELFLKHVGPNPHLWLLNKCRGFLKPGGLVVVAIENALGLKYWNGSAEDHRATLFDSICGYPDSPTPRTFSRKALSEMLGSAGFGKVDTFYPFPDYKIPTTIVSEKLFSESPDLSAELAMTEPYRDYLGFAPVKYFSDTLATQNLARAGLLEDFSNSFLFVAAVSDSPIRKKFLERHLNENELGWHYGHGRRSPTQTIFFQDRRSPNLLVHKTGLYASEHERTYSSPLLGKIQWSALGPEPVLKGHSVRLLLARQAYFQDWTGFWALFVAYLRWSMRQWELAGKTGVLDGRSLDGVFVNARLGENANFTSGESPKHFVLFDQEWKSEQPIPLSWFVLRNVFNLVREETLVRQNGLFNSFSDLYSKLCRELGCTPDLEGDLRREAELQALTSRGTAEHHYQQLRGLFVRSVGQSLLPRDPSIESALRNPEPAWSWNGAGLKRLAKKTVRAIFRGAKALLLRFPRAKKKIARLAKALLASTGAVRSYCFAEKPVFLASDTGLESTALLNRFPKGWVLLRILSPEVPPSIRFGVRVDGQFAEVTVREKGRVWLLKVDTAVESLTVSGAITGIPLKVRRMVLAEALFRLFARFRPEFWKGKRWARAQIAVPVIDAYSAWVEKHGTLTEEDTQVLRAAVDGFAERPLISIVMPVFNTPEKWLRAAIASVQNQTYPHWELCIADDASSDPQVLRVLKEIAERDPRVRFMQRPSNGHISAASNSALSMAQGAWVGLLDHDDVLAPQALSVVVQAINHFAQTDLFYSDEDKIDAFGRRFDPHFKPDWNPELFYSKNFVSHFSVFRKSVLDRIGGFREGFEGSQDYDLVLRFTEATTAERIRHIPEILYHWRAIPGSVALAESEKSYAHERARRAIAEHLERKGKKAVVEKGFGMMHRVRYALPDPSPLVSVIIPTRDRRDLLKKVVEGLRHRTEYAHWELILVDNQTSDPSTLDFFRLLKQDSRVRILRDDNPFNFSALVNLAAGQAKGSILLLLNNDIEMVEPQWLTELVSLAVQQDIGCVGAKLLYPDGTIQHAGVYLGIGGVADHLYRFFPAESSAAQGNIQLCASVSAVTAACLAVRKAVFDTVGGFDAQYLSVAYNDVDFCLKVKALGLRNLYQPAAKLVHAESASRGADTDPVRVQRFEGERDIMKKRWGKGLESDFAYSPSLSLKGPHAGLAYPPRHLPFYRVAPSVKGRDKGPCVPVSSDGKSDKFLR